MLDVNGREEQRRHRNPFSLSPPPSPRPFSPPLLWEMTSRDGLGGKRQGTKVSCDEGLDLSEHIVETENARTN